MRPLLRPLIAIAVLLAAAGARAGNWPQWRGPAGDGVSTETGLPIAFSESAGVEWKCELPEWGTSTPAVSGDAIFLTSHAEDRRLLLLRIDKQTGNVVWTRQVGTASAPRGSNPWDRSGGHSFHKDHNLASPSPVTDGQVVVGHFGNGDRAAYEFDGEPLWQRNLQEDYGRYTLGWGHANSPVLYGELVISVCIQNSTRGPAPRGPSYVVAHDKRTGRQQWHVPRPTEATGVSADSYATPILRKAGERTELVVAGGQMLDAYDPASGKRWWHLPGLVGNETIGSPVAAHGMIYMTQAKGPLSAVRPGGDGERSRDEIVWEFGDCLWDAPSPVVWGEWIFVVSNNGVARCLGVHTGRLLWKDRVRGNYRASPLAAEGRVYFLNTEGLMTVISASPRFDRLTENRLDVEHTFASPAVSDGKLLLRGKKWLYCISR